MKMHQDSLDGSYKIVRYGADGVQINEQIYTQSLLLMPDQIISPWAPNCLEELNSSHLTEAQSLNPEVILLGTGMEQKFPDRAVMRPILQSGIGLEVMDTGSACRTYNILMGEGRRVVAALLISTQ
ncbi:MAG: Mth938-like domain-containing protein [Gammaproteobacteria bacterium]|nr:Mth938-like domain-containing protein [Gammaproteobacteria bacterium]